MTSRAARFRQSDLTRAMRGAIAAGMRVGRVEIDPGTGRIVVMSETSAPRLTGSSWDEVLR